MVLVLGVSAFTLDRGLRFRVQGLQEAIEIAQSKTYELFTDFITNCHTSTNLGTAMN